MRISISLPVGAGPAFSLGKIIASRTRQGSPVTLKAPAEPGDYEVRYVILRYKASDSGEVLGRTPFQVE